MCSGVEEYTVVYMVRSIPVVCWFEAGENRTQASSDGGVVEGMITLGHRAGVKASSLSRDLSFSFSMYRTLCCRVKRLYGPRKHQLVGTTAAPVPYPPRFCPSLLYKPSTLR